MANTVGRPAGQSALQQADTDAIVESFGRVGYVLDKGLATTLFLLLRLGRPLLLEGHAGVGKTELARALSLTLPARLIRLQCYEGLDVQSTIYEWNYQRQLLAIKIQESAERTVEEKEAHIFGESYLLPRPLLQAIMETKRAPVLLIDEIDRADEVFEAFLLELLSEFQITIPEIGTIKAAHVPYIILTSNRTRELSDALKRRCLYHWVDYPDHDREMRIVASRMPGVENLLADQVVRFVQSLRQLKLAKAPGVAESIDWAAALMTLGQRSLDETSIERTIGCILKSKEDIEECGSKGFRRLLAEALAA